MGTVDFKCIWHVLADVLQRVSCGCADATLLPTTITQWLNLTSASASSFRSPRKEVVELHARLEHFDLVLLQSLIKLQGVSMQGPPMPTRSCHVSPRS